MGFDFVDKYDAIYIRNSNVNSVFMIDSILNSIECNRKFEIYFSFSKEKTPTSKLFRSFFFGTSLRTRAYP